MEVESFEKTSSSVAKSVIAIAIGKNLDNKPNIVGTGFAIEVPECFATCWHVAEIEDTLKKLTKKELAKKFQLIDNKLRVARMTKVDTYEWQEIEEGTWFRASDKKMTYAYIVLSGFQFHRYIYSMKKPTRAAAK